MTTALGALGRAHLGLNLGWRASSPQPGALGCPPLPVSQQRFSDQSQPASWGQVLPCRTTALGVGAFGTMVLVLRLPARASTTKRSAFRGREFMQKSSEVGFAAAPVVTSGASSAASPSGEWAFRASVLGNDGALSGHLFLDESGRAAYIADGVQIVGRGVGRWLVAGGAAGVELEVFQYAAASVNLPDRPHRFRGIWETGSDGALRGDWYFCPDGGEAPRLVGSFDAAGTNMELLPMAIASGAASGPMPRVSSPAVRQSVMAALDAKLDSVAIRPSASLQERLAPYLISDVPTIYYIPDWIEPSQEADFMEIADGDMLQWEEMKTRSSQEWGSGDRCSCGRGLQRQGLPEKQRQLAEALHHLGVFDGALYPLNSIRINGYRPGQGIYPHCDGPVYYPKVAILSLGSPCVFSFYPRTGSEDCMQWNQEKDVPGGHQAGDKPLASVVLEPRSLLIFSHDAFWHHRHGIDAVASEEVTDAVCNLHTCGGRYKVGDVINRSRRVSLTMRHLLPRCACQG
mmetsp:Transcript_126138/g.315260  ORF Transcript_126138/g.315260 Transcript_126138/m.315260 type:complete len:516 (-) Transcript_126138:77-1624(-)